MSLCVKLKPLNRPCGSISGGIAKIWVFDGADFDFTQAAVDPTTGYQPYTAIALTAAATTAAVTHAMYPISFQQKEAEYSYKQSSKAGYYTKYEHQLSLNVPDQSMLVTNWNMAIDAAGVCCGVSLAILLNSGRILIAGEKSVNGSAVDVPMWVYQDGSSGTSGKLMDDPNAASIMLKWDYKRPLFEFTGGVSALIALQ